MNISDRGIIKLTVREGLRLKAYQDEAGVWTIGVGHTETAKEGMEISHDEAVRLLKRDLRKHVDAVNRYVTRGLTQSQFDALVSFAFNVGNHAFKTSTLLEELNAGRFYNVPVEMMRWNKVTVHGRKRTSAGLVYRRVAECAQWYESRIEREYTTKEVIA